MGLGTSLARCWGEAFAPLLLKIYIRAMFPKERRTKVKILLKHYAARR